MLSFKKYVDAVVNNGTTIASQLRFKKECYEICTENVQ